MDRANVKDLRLEIKQYRLQLIDVSWYFHIILIIHFQGIYFTSKVQVRFNAELFHNYNIISRDVTNRFFHEPNEHKTSKQNHEPSRAS